MMKSKVLIAGAVACGASVAARLRRLSEDVEIVLFDKGDYMSFANCGLPYYVGEEVEDLSDIEGKDPQNFYDLHNIEVRLKHEIIELDPENKKVSVTNLETGETYEDNYDHFVIATGAAPKNPGIKGIEREGVFNVITVPDAIDIDEWINQKKCHKAVIIGGGYIGLEMLDQLYKRKLELTLIEHEGQVMSNLDIEMANILHRKIFKKGINVKLGRRVIEIQEADVDKQRSWQHSHKVILDDGSEIESDLIIVATGVKPRVELAESAGLEIGVNGGIIVNENLQTNKHHIWAGGDVVEVIDLIRNKSQHIPLAGPAIMHGRTIAENIAGIKTEYKASLGVSIFKIFDYDVAFFGLTENELLELDQKHEVIHLHSNTHSGYYPGVERITMKLIFDPDSKLVLGVQIIGKDGVDKRIDVLATAVQAGLTVDEFDHLELSYAPPYNSAKDPINVMGMLAENLIDSYVKQIQWHEIDELDKSKSYLLDLRSKDERRENGFIDESHNIPFEELRERYQELPEDKEIIVYCQAGPRSYSATRFLENKGYSARFLAGSFLTYKNAYYCPSKRKEEPAMV